MKYSEKSDKSAFTNLTAPPMMKECPPHPWSVPDDVFGETVRPISDVTTIVTLSHNPAATNASRKPFKYTTHFSELTVENILQIEMCVESTEIHGKGVSVDLASFVYSKD